MSGQDVQVKTPGSFPDYNVPTRLLVELRHKRFKKPWRKIIHIGQAVMAQSDRGADLEYFVNTTFNYPTMAEAYRVAALNGLNRL